MRYTVTCQRALENKLALIWLHDTDGPLDVGEPFGANRRLSIEPPLTAIYTVSPDDCLVEILDYIFTG